MLKVLTWLWQQPGGRIRYEPWHVQVWADMVRRNLAMPHTLAVVTDIAADFGAGIEVIPLPRDFENVRIPTWGASRPQCFRRLSLFRRDAGRIFGAERIVSMDLDVVITASLDPLFAGGEDFRICRGTAAARSFNGSMVMLRAGSRPEVFETFTPERAVLAGRKHVGSDQSWIAHCLAGRQGSYKEATWGPEDGVVAVQQRHLAKVPRMITWPGPIKPWAVAGIGGDRLVSEHYRRSPSGTGLILGHAPGVWDDVAVALAGGRRFDAVIASPETAPYWPAPVLAIADDDAHAGRLAAMHGLAEVVVCGRTERMTT